MSIDAIEAHASQPFVTHDHVAEKMAFLSLARGSSRRAVRLRNEARDYERAGRLDDYRRCVAEARRQQKQAWNALSFARLEAGYEDA